MREIRIKRSLYFRKYTCAYVIIRSLSLSQSKHPMIHFFRRRLFRTNPHNEKNKSRDEMKNPIVFQEEEEEEEKEGPHKKKV